MAHGNNREGADKTFLKVQCGFLWVFWGLPFDERKLWQFKWGFSSHRVSYCDACAEWDKPLHRTDSLTDAGQAFQQNLKYKNRRVHLQLDESQMPKCKGCAHHYHMLVFHSHFIVQFFLLKRQAKSHCSELAGCGKHWVHEGLTHFVSPRAKSVLASLMLLVIWGFCRHHTTLSSLKNLAVLRDGGFSVHLYICF